MLKKHGSSDMCIYEFLAALPRPHRSDPFLFMAESEGLTGVQPMLSLIILVQFLVARARD